MFLKTKGTSPRDYLKPQTKVRKIIILTSLTPAPPVKGDHWSDASGETNSQGVMGRSSLSGNSFLIIPVYYFFIPLIDGLYFIGNRARSLVQVQDGPAAPGKRIEEASDSFMHTPLGSGGI
jgi:hypothetical protein